MEINVSELGPCRRKVAAEIPAADVAQEFAKSYRELAGGAAIPGFRKGRVPRAVLRRRYGERVSQQVKATLLHELLKSIIDDHKLDPVKDPDLDIEALEISESEAFKVELELEVKPDFELGEYKGIEVEGCELELDESRVEETIELLRKQKAEWAPVDGAEIADGDHLICTLKIAAGDEVIDDAENIPVLVDSKREVAHIGLGHDALVGKKSGDEVAGETKLGDEFPGEDHRGKDVSYTLTINAHKRRELPDLDEDFFAEYDCESLEELQDRVRHKLQHDLEHDAHHVVIDRIVDKLLESADFDIPESVMDHERRRMRQDAELELRRSQTPEEEIPNRVEEALEDGDEKILRKVRRTYILERIAREEDLEADEDEVDHRIAGMAQAQGMWPSQMREVLEARGLMDQIYSSVTLHKVQHFLLEHASIDGVVGAAGHHHCGDPDCGNPDCDEHGKDETSDSEASDSEASDSEASDSEASDSEASDSEAKNSEDAEA